MIIPEMKYQVKQCAAAQQFNHCQVLKD